VPVQRLNHAVLFGRDVDRSVAFYRDVLGFRVDRLPVEHAVGTAPLDLPRVIERYGADLPGGVSVSHHRS